MTGVPDDAAATRVHLLITGDVQGVSFRYYAQQRAAAFQLAGWIRNRPDGAVEAVVQGAEDAVREFVAWARRGPSAARVDQVDVRDETPVPELHVFRIVG